MDAIIEQLKTLALAEAFPFLLKAVGALVLWFVGRAVINTFRRVLNITLQKRQFDATLIRYIESLFAGSLTILLLLGILGMMGFETTSFAALLAAAGIAIGTAWSGLLSNFAAGIFLLVLRPFRVGDEISAAGATGLVQEIGLFATTIDTSDNLRISVGNNRLFGDNIVNYSHHPHRKIVVKVPMMHGGDVHALMRALAERVALVPEVQAKPAPSVEVAEFSVLGPVLGIGVYCKPPQATAVQAGVAMAASEILMAAGYVVPPQTANQVLAKAS
ncbi:MULTISPECIES: mechanosensitive ion channel family protein [Myxococcus]|uniref:Mechanosensitive ion channel family protein n=1 Tax=Myxococcus llanfairpwllgwyngyllgogerychwyrndrobwllllantysiliogogogochensis TaxID=2590453 RepID=A0A540WVL9_9BACT|nr:MULTISPECIES: mechanosensitive ion channel family protein [Myxococcus]NTX07717.1 mechanosensitive ion channel family protein [Myxococcus sp. CA040A]TQF13061.1 mechanosensitive ion channel family protein [Myxococcus llanfairpwllgwyngyllgogerychwyrndrobwllllantysiliogogogochensis]